MSALLDLLIFCRLSLDPCSFPLMVVVQAPHDRFEYFKRKTALYLCALIYNTRVT